jgi:hypothetical protein
VPASLQTRSRSTRIAVTNRAPLGGWLLCAAALVAFPKQAEGQISQVQDARLPRQGELWFELTPTLAFWSSQFALDSEGVADGQKEPLTTDFTGLLTNRLYPNALPFLVDINADADALGYDPLEPEDLSFGDLDYREIANRKIALPLGLKIGILDRLSLDVTLPLVQTRSESFFGYDSTSASVTAGMNAVADPVTFFGEFETAETSLASLIDGGTLTPEETALAVALLGNSTAFSSALERRVLENLFVPVGASTAGAQMSSTYEALAAGYTAFGLALPALELPPGAAASDLTSLFASPQIAGDAPGTVTSGYSMGELEVGLRFGLIDTFTPITWFEDVPPTPTRPPEEAPAEGEEGAEPDEAQQPVEHSETVRRLARRPNTLQLRTSIGAKYRFPLSDPNGSPYLDPSNFLDIPIGDGQRDLELSLFQDVRVGPRFLFLSSFYYGIQMADEVDLRVNPPDQPFGLAATLSTLQRNLGDYFAARAAPQVFLNQVIAFGLEYNYWNKGNDSYELISGSVSSGEPLEIKTSETRHMLGGGIFYRTQDLWEDGRTSLPVEIVLMYVTSIGGSGGQTPAGDRMTVYVRFPARVF